MPANRQPREMDNPYYDWSPIVDRPPLRWPNGARVALCTIVNLEHLEWLPPADSVIPPSAVKHTAYPKIFDMHDVSNHEYGNRVGIFRVMDTLDRYGLKATVAVDAAVAERYPFLVTQCLERQWEAIGHGVAFSRMITNVMPEPEERAHIRYALDAIERAFGSRPAGWIGVDYGESTRTVRLLAEHGVRYVCDWPNDEQPYRMHVPSGLMVSLPVTIDLDDIFTIRERRVPVQRWAQMVADAFDRLYRDGAETGRLLILNLHPYFIGQPFRIKYLDQALSYIMRRRDGVWCATGSEIVDWYLEQTT